MQNRKKREQKANKKVMANAEFVRKTLNENIYANNITKRISWVDNAKALGIIAVFYGHIVEKIFLTVKSPIVCKIASPI